MWTRVITKQVWSNMSRTNKGCTDDCFAGIISGVPEQDVVVWVWGPSWGNCKLRVSELWWRAPGGSTQNWSSKWAPSGSKRSITSGQCLKCHRSPLILGREEERDEAYQSLVSECNLGVLAPSEIYTEYLHRIREQWNGGEGSMALRWRDREKKSWNLKLTDN